MSILQAKLNAARQRQQAEAAVNAPGTPRVEAKRPVVTPTPIPVRDGIPRRTRGRPRKRLTKALFDHPPIAEWVTARLSFMPGNCVTVGGWRKHYITHVNGKRIRAEIDHRGRPTLAADFEKWCAEHNYPPTRPRCFSGLILHETLSKGWQVRCRRSGQLRRVILEGVALENAPAWTGEDFDPSIDPPRWRPRPKPPLMETPE